MSKSQVSLLARELDQTVQDFRERPLGVCPYLWVDALVHKGREGGRIVNVATVGVNHVGSREILGVDVLPPKMALPYPKAHWKLGLGTLVLGADDLPEENLRGQDCDTATAWRILDAAVDAGVTYFDTADVYGQGRAERLVGDWLRRSDKRQHVVLGTKVRLKIGVHSDD